MKKVGEIMREMGFNSSGSDEAKKAFIKYLLRVARHNKHNPEPFFETENPDGDEWQELKLHSRGLVRPTQRSNCEQRQEVTSSQETVANSRAQSVKQAQQLSFDFTAQEPDDKAG
jgi:hypothetical protein